VRLNGRDILSISSEELRRIRGNEISIIFQDAVASLNPVLSIGNQMVEGITVHLDATKKDAEKMSLHLLEQVGLPDPERIMRGYPFQLSGGMAQRVMMAMAVALSPRVLIADEPTSNLDVTLQAELLHRLRTLRQEYETAILLITHDMGVVAGIADAVAVMYAGSLVEYSDTRTVFERPAHPYTWALLQAVPRLDSPYSTLRPLAGSPPDPMEIPAECPFLPRCPKASSTCRTSPMPPLIELEPGHKVACYNPVEPQR
jgi:oligopeptide/dipeptide ABC transporter ATP-binding protein